MVFHIGSRESHLRLCRYLLSTFFLTLLLTGVRAQQLDTAGLNSADLNGLIHYALKHQPQIQQSVIDQEITERQIKAKLADWYPQINFGYTYQHNFDLPLVVMGDTRFNSGQNNTSALQLTGTQNIFNRDLLLAQRTRKEVTLLSAKQLELNKINLSASVAKAYYDLLATIQQRRVTGENIRRLEKSLNDAKANYDVGIVDNTDYKRATISLNNAFATQKQLDELIAAKKENLKALINYPQEATLSVNTDSTTLENDIYLDTLVQPDYANRVEYVQLQTQLKLQEANLSYNKWSYLPTLSANGAYIRNFMNNDFGKLYNVGFPTSYVGLGLTFPIFQGGKRKQNIHIAERQVDQAKLDITAFKNQMSSEYHTAMANYKSSLANYLALKENMRLAQEVYDVINLQYREGIKTYLDVITAETDLRTAQVNYFNAIYNLLSSKIDVQKAEGSITVN